jgi:cystine transport system substrate-binding protein
MLWYGHALVLGQAHTPRRRYLPFAAIALLVLAAPTVGGADASHTAVLRAHDAQLAAKSRAAVLDLYSLDQRFGAAQSRLAGLRTQTVTLRAQEASLSYQLSIARRGAVVAQSRLGARLRLLYEQGNVEPLEIVFGARSLDDALSSLDNLSRASSQGKDVLRQLKAARRNILASQHALAARRQSLALAVAQAESTATALARTRAARSAYIGSLASQRRLGRQQIASLVARAEAAQVRSGQLVRGPATAGAEDSTGAATSIQAGSRTITVDATGYSLGGRTATGLPVGWGVVAVDPAVIPLGSHMQIPGYGDAVAADTGGSVVGATIDLWFPTVAQANAWGRRTVTIVLH